MFDSVRNPFDEVRRPFDKLRRLIDEVRSMFDAIRSLFDSLRSSFDTLQSLFDAIFYTKKSLLLTTECMFSCFKQNLQQACTYSFISKKAKLIYSF